MSAFSKRIGVIVLLFVITVPAFFLAGLLIKQKMIQAQMNDRLEQSPVQTISLPLASVNWVKEGKELLYDGKLIDIKSYCIDGDKIILQGLFDNDEDNLITKIKEVDHQGKDNNSPLGQIALKYLSQQICNELQAFSIDNPWKIIDNTLISYSAAIPDPHYSLVVPPPKEI